MANYQYVIDSHFNPFSMQEMLLPFTMYKDAYEKAEEAYTDLSTKADQFKYLSKTLPEDSRARQIYEGYAEGLAAQAKDLARNGLSMGNRRALSDYKRRYAGEIGLLASAQTKLDEELKLRRATALKDPTMLYGAENLTIDDFLDGKSPSMYAVSGDTLYTRAANAAKNASMRIYSTGDGGSTLGGYYRQWVEKMGISPEDLYKFRDEIQADFRKHVSTLPEFQKMAQGILTQYGVYENLSGEALRKAEMSVLNGIIDGAVYQEKATPQRDPGVLSAAEKRSADLADNRFKFDKDKYNDSLQVKGYIRDDTTGKLVYNEEADEGIKEINAKTAATLRYREAVKEQKEKEKKEKEKKGEKDRPVGSGVIDKNGRESVGTTSSKSVSGGKRVSYNEAIASLKEDSPQRKALENYDPKFIHKYTIYITSDGNIQLLLPSGNLTDVENSEEDSSEGSSGGSWFERARSTPQDENWEDVLEFDQ